MTYRLIATDLDGTLLPTEQADPWDPLLSDRTHGTLTAARAAGATVVAITARSPRTTVPFALRHGFDGLAICGNGSIVYDLDADAIARSVALEPGIVAELIQALRRAIPGVTFAAEQGMTFAREPAHPRSIYTPDPHVEADALSFVASLVTTKLIVRHTDTPLDELVEVVRSVVGDAAVAELHGGEWVAVLHPHATKATALRSLCEHLGIAREDVIAFGDHPMDAAMLSWAGLGVAVANATQEVQAAADRIAPSNDEDGVAVVLEELLAAGAIG